MPDLAESLTRMLVPMLQRGNGVCDVPASRDEFPRIQWQKLDVYWGAGFARHDRTRVNLFSVSYKGALRDESRQRPVFI